MDQIIAATSNLIFLLLGVAGSFFVQRLGRREKLVIKEAIDPDYAHVQMAQELAEEHRLGSRHGVRLDLVADLVNKGSHPATVRRWSWFMKDTERGGTYWPIASEIRLAKLGEQEFDPPKELTTGVFGTPFIIGAGDVAVLAFSGIFPGASYMGLDVGMTELCVKYWGSEQEYEWRV